MNSAQSGARALEGETVAPGEGGAVVPRIPAQAGSSSFKRSNWLWIPAFAGMSG